MLWACHKPVVCDKVVPCKSPFRVLKSRAKQLPKCLHQENVMPTSMPTSLPRLPHSPSWHLMKLLEPNWTFHLSNLIKQLGLIEFNNRTLTKKLAQSNPIELWLGSEIEHNQTFKPLFWFDCVQLPNSMEPNRWIRFDWVRLPNSSSSFVRLTRL